MGDDALTSAFTRLRGRFLRMALRFFPEEEDANDALQDAFCRLWKLRGEIATEHDAAAMAVTTIRHLGIDGWRQRQGATFLALDAERDGVEEPSTGDRLEAKEKFAIVERIIDGRLSETQRKVLRMKEYEGESYEAIARELGMEQSAVRMQLSRARKTIRECYKKIEGYD